MERSFEDLLHGLSDESEPELDDMILGDDLDNTNLESILVSPNRSNNNSDVLKTPSGLSSQMVHKTSTPKADTDDLDLYPTSSDIKDTPPEVIVYTPEEDDKQEDLNTLDKELDGIRADSKKPTDGEVENMSRRNQTGSRTRSRTGSTKDANDEDIDLSAISDTNHLDVNVTKHKSTLGKKGSLARRRSQTRKGRKSLLSGGEDAIFQDSTEPRQATRMNREDETNIDPFDMSPPAKKHSPSTVVPLPGLSSKPRSQQPSSSTPEDAMSPSGTKKVSKPPPGAFRLPGFPAKMDKPKPVSRNSKPVAQDASPVPFERVGLKSVQTPGSSPDTHTDRDIKFEKPVLRSTPKPARERSEERMDISSGVFTKPQLRSTPKPQSDVEITVPEKKPLTGETQGLTNIFDTPLRPTGRRLTSDTEEKDENESAKTFEKPPLRTTRRNPQSDSVVNTVETSNHAFEKPHLRSTPTSQKDERKNEDVLSGLFDKPALKKAESVDRETNVSSEPKGLFEKPALRTTPSPEKEIKDVKGAKGVFSRPSLKKTDARKVSNESRKVPEKPEWLQAAASKGPKVLDVLHTKENKSIEKAVPSWLEKESLRKGQPLQDTSNSQSHSREPAIGLEGEGDRKERTGSSVVSSNKDTNYAPSWVRQTRSSSLTAGGPVSKVSDTEEVPQWKRELAQRQLKRKEQSPLDQARKEESSEPEWKKNTLRKVQPAAPPSRELRSVEPEWKKAAEEKHARLRKQQVHVAGSSDQSEC